MTPVPFQQVRLTDSVFSPVQHLVSDFVIDHQWKIFNGAFGNTVYSPSLDNFRILAGDREGRFQGNIFQGGDLAKWLEGACIRLQCVEDAELVRHVEEVVDVLARAQQEDGYLGAYYQLQEPGKRFTNLIWSHELFFYGHLAEAAIAHQMATGKDTLMRVVEKYTDLIERTFGPDRLRSFDGHPECERALMRLYEYTGQDRYLRLAKFFVDVYGERPSCYAALYEQEPEKLEEYLQSMMADRPVREANEIHGHAVRAVYLAAGMADVARATQDSSLWAACMRLWESCVQRKQYLSGGIGSTRHWEAFGCDYDLPNDRTYQETCANIGMVYFAFSMLRGQPRAEYADIIERCLYNSILSGLSFDGTRFFYVNPLETWPPVHGSDPDFTAVKPVRQRWYQTACCPTNLARFLPSVGGYLYAVQEDRLYVHQYMSNEASFHWLGQDIGLCVEGDYPWQGNVTLRLRLQQPACGTVLLRIPGWCRGRYAVHVNSVPCTAPCEAGYLPITRERLSQPDTYDHLLDQFVNCPSPGSGQMGISSVSSSIWLPWP